MIERAKFMFRYDVDSFISICERDRRQQDKDQVCTLVNPSADQVREKMRSAVQKAKENNKDVIVNIDMDLEHFTYQYPFPPRWNRWYPSVKWAGEIANIVSEAFREEIPSGYRMLYAHSAGVDATNRSIQLRPGEMMYDDLNLFNGRTPAESLRNTLLSSEYTWWQVKVFTNTWDFPLLTGPSSLSNYDAAKKWAGEAWVHLHGTSWNTRGHSGLIKAIDVPVQFKINMGLPSSTYITDTVENMMFNDWSE